MAPMTTKNELIAILSRPTFDAGFTEWLATASMEEIEGSYAECYKDAHGIKARWVYDAGITREAFADMFVTLGHDIKAENDRLEAEQAAFVERIASLGLTEWAERNGIRTEHDLWEHNYREECKQFIA